MIRVGIVTPDWPSITDGGIASLMATLALGLERVGADVTVFTRGGGSRDRQLDDPAAMAPWSELRSDVNGVPGRSWARLGAWHWRRGLSGALDELDALIVARHDELAPVLAVRPPRLPVAVFAHGRDVTAELSASRARRRRAAFAAPVRWLGLTRWMQGQLGERGVIGAGVVPAAVPGAPRSSGGRTILSLGRLIRRKGHDVLLDALARRPDDRLVVVGDGPERPALEARAQARGVADRVTFDGFLSPARLERRWAEASMLVLPCRTEADGDTEGFGLVFLEAAARGLPSIAGGEGGAVEAVVHGRTGLVLDDPRDPDALAAAIGRLRLDGASLGAAAHDAWFRHHRPEHLGAAVLDALFAAAAA